MTGFDRLISLGNFCQTAHQIRRRTGDRTTFFFDWLVTPQAGLQHLLDTDFTDAFRQGNLQVTPRGDSVVDVSTGVLYHHSFSRGPDGQITPGAIAREYDAQRAKIDHLIARWHDALRGARVLFVRQEAYRPDALRRLWAALEARHPGCGLLVAQPPGHDAGVAHPRIHLATVAMPPDSPTSWQGDDAAWDAAFDAAEAMAQRDAA